MNDTPIDPYELQDEVIRELIAHNKNLRALCARAADALEPYALGFPDGRNIRALIAELRDAAK